MLKSLLFAGLATVAVADSGPGFLKFDITGHKPEAGLGRRQKEVDLTNHFSGTAYTIDLEIGTPPQKVTVQLDSGSTDLWVNANCDHVPNAGRKSFCAGLPRFNPSSSSSYKSLGSTFELIYGIGNASVAWATDDITVGSGKISSQQFGVASDSFSIPFGILGIAPNTGSSDHPVYPFFIDSLASQGLTESRAFSLDLRSSDSPDGSIIFGGIDTKKFTGYLEKIPIIPAAESPQGDRYWVYLNAISHVSASGTSTSALGSSIPVVLDSGSTLTALPASVVRAVGSTFPTAQLDVASGMYVVSCSVADQDGSVDFTFGTKTIKVPYKDIVWKATDTLCALGLEPVTSSLPVAILGDTFLRAAYAVFDQDNRNIHLAQAANCGTNIVSIKKGADGVPSGDGECDGSSSPSSSSSIPPASSTSSSPESTEASTEVSATSTTEAPSSASEAPSSSDQTTVEPSTTAVSTPAGPATTGNTTSTSTSANTTPVVTAGVGKVMANAGVGAVAVVAAILL